MKKQLLLSIVILFAVIKTQGQVLYNETFDSYTLGNLGTDVTGTTAGQGGWYTTWGLNTNYQIITEPNKGKVLSMFVDNPQQSEDVSVEKQNLSTLIDQRSPGNNVIKIEVDFYTGTLNSPSNDNSNVSHIYLYFDPPQNFTNPKRLLMDAYYNYKNNLLSISGFNGINLIPTKSKYSSLAANTWYTFVFYLDYTNQKCYFEIPGKNYVTNGAFLNVTNPLDFKLSKIDLSMNIDNLQGTTKREQRYDNFKITALKDVPAHVLSNNEFLYEQFNVYPNPATNVVNITNSATIAVSKIALYDVTGKLMKEETYNSAEPIQVNVANLPSGTYVFHIETDQGTAVKKIVKQ